MTGLKTSVCQLFSYRDFLLYALTCRPFSLCVWIYMGKTSEIIVLVAPVSHYITNGGLLMVKRGHFFTFWLGPDIKERSSCGCRSLTFNLFLQGHWLASKHWIFLFITPLLLVVGVQNVKSTYRKSCAGNLLEGSDLQ